MRILLDTHAFLWWLAGSSRLVETARRAIADDDNDVLVSAATAWEITTKYRLGKLPEADALASDIRAAIAGQGFEELPVSVGDAEWRPRPLTRGSGFRRIQRKEGHVPLGTLDRKMSRVDGAHWL